MSCSNHVNIFRTHFQSFRHYRKSVIMIIAKCILSVILIIIFPKSITRREMRCLSVMNDLCSCVINKFKCLIIVLVSSLFTLVSLILHLAIFWKASLPSNIPSPDLPKLCIAHYLYSIYKFSKIVQTQMGRDHVVLKILWNAVQLSV